jgi:hypothetical protein
MDMWDSYKMARAVGDLEDLYDKVHEWLSVL